MPLQVRGHTDQYIDAIAQVLDKHLEAHSRAEIEIYRQNSVSIRIRIVDPDFKGVSRTERHNQVWALLDDLPEKVQSQLTTLLLLTPQEKVSSFASFEFDDPIPSNL